MYHDPTSSKHFHLFQSLGQVGAVFQDVVQAHVPSFATTLEHAGVPICLLAYKWFPTLFSDVTLVASQAPLRFETLLFCWDVCFLLGVDGLFCVAVVLCRVAENDLKRLVQASAELGSATFGRVLAELTPAELIFHLRKARFRRFRRDVCTRQDEDAKCKESIDLSLMTVTDLDSGKVFRLSFTGTLVLLMT
ncbi:hypothetical protein CCR75_007630 [Bremia lactucae]|uniref:Rab-GAP TBC domain-containing protein n=1 Tax=Bremia lactucae TaxID=4779 RepID=A0A976IFC5_BRELC|nr:hypothetical protein CCR75_007630 [Bremia lactucae]